MKNPIGGSRRSVTDVTISMSSLQRRAGCRLGLCRRDSDAYGKPWHAQIYEIYDRIALGGMGHPADLVLRFPLLEMAHIEDSNWSPSDDWCSRLMVYGLAPGHQGLW